jgi:ketosteroid isomerase-like protein
MSLPVRALLLGLLTLFVSTGCESTPRSSPKDGRERGSPAGNGDTAASIAHNKRERDAVSRVLDGWHQAATDGNIDAYFGYLSEDSTFLGTDATERWSKDEFLAYAKPVHESTGGMWNIQPFDRFIVIEGDHAWLDEGLRNETYPDWRGTGVLSRTDDGWKIVHYSMTFTIPNGVTGAVKQLVEEHAADSEGPR